MDDNTSIVLFVAIIAGAWALVRIGEAIADAIASRGRRDDDE